MLIKRKKKELGFVKRQDFVPGAAQYCDSIYSNFLLNQVRYKFI